MSMVDTEMESREVVDFPGNPPSRGKVRRGFRAFPTPGRRYPSLRKLEHRIDDFFDPDYEPTNSRDMQNGRRTILDLAYWLGYRSRPELYRDVYDKKEPEYGKMLLAAIDKLNAEYEYKAMRTAEENADAKTMMSIVDRNDKIIDRFNPDAGNDKGGMKITINLAHDERVRNVLADSVRKLDMQMEEARRMAVDAHSAPVTSGLLGHDEGGDE